jgi:hypothetical protein
MSEKQNPRPVERVVGRQGSQARALAMLAEHGPLRPADFARYMWPDNPNWRRPGKCGAYGSSKGLGMRLAGGGYLGRLCKAGLVRYTQYPREGWVLTASGEQLLPPNA